MHHTTPAVRTAATARRCRVAAAAALAVLAGAAAADPITLNDPYQWLEVRSTNTVGRIAGLRQLIGVTSVLPTSTTATATQGSTVLALPFNGTTAIPNEFSVSLPASPSTYGAWTLNFSNGANTATAVTPAISAGLQPMPFVADVRATNNASTSFAWSIPAAASVDAVRINLFDHGRLNVPGNNIDIVYNTTLSASATSFTLPSVLANGLPLVAGNLYTLEISLLDFASNSPNGSQNDLRNRSRLYVDFRPGPTSTAGAYLPIVEPGINGAAPVFHFNVSSVGTDLIYIDPDVATGYTYRTGAGNPNFRSVLLPAGIGDGLYSVVLPDGTSFAVTGGTAFMLPAGGVSSFTVLGIEESAGLNTNDPTAFMTGLTFTGAGSFTGTMQAVPEVPAWALLLGGGALLSSLRRRRAVAV